MIHDIHSLSQSMINWHLYSAEILVMRVIRLTTRVRVPSVLLKYRYSAIDLKVSMITLNS